MNDSIISVVNYILDFFLITTVQRKSIYYWGSTHFPKKNPIKARREEKMSGMAIGMFEMQNANACHIAAT